MTNTRNLETRVFECSTALGLATLCTILGRAERKGRRVLVVSINSPHCEVEDWYTFNPRMQAIAAEHFDQIVLLNEVCFPIHPSRWEGPPFEQIEALAAATGPVDRVVELYVESIHVPPSLTLAQLFTKADVHVYSDGLMVYSPTRNRLPPEVERRVSCVHYVEFLPGVRPLLLCEIPPRYTPIPPHELRPFFARLAEGTSSDLPAGTVVFLGQCFNAHRMMSVEDEIAIYLDALLLLHGASAIESIAFKPHITAQASLTRAVATRFERLSGRELRIVSPEEPIESLLGTPSVVAVAGVFSTALFTARLLFDVPAFKFRPKDVLHRLKPFENSNRMPLVAADMYLPSLYDVVDRLGDCAPGDAPARLRELAATPGRDLTEKFERTLLAVGYQMQPQILAPLKAAALEAAKSEDIPALDLYLYRKDSGQNVRRRVLDYAITQIATPFLVPTKAAKLKRSPNAFFTDSKHRSVRALGQLYSLVTR